MASESGEAKKSKVEILRDRWNGQEERIQKIVESLQKEEDWTVHLKGLPYVEEIEPINSEALGRDLRGINLGRANLGRANLRWVDLRWANLGLADLGDAFLSKADLRWATFIWADLTGANLSKADLGGADLGFANFSDVDVTGVEFNRETKCQGIRIATSYGSAAFKRFAQDQDFLEEFEESTKKSWRLRVIFYLWKYSSDFGRSALWTGWSVLLAVGFCLCFLLLGNGAFESKNLPWSFCTALYYSVVTFTTLGFGDVVPKNYLAAFLVMAEVITGYVMLGGLIAIFANKLAKRS